MKSLAVALLSASLALPLAAAPVTPGAGLPAAGAPVFIQCRNLEFYTGRFVSFDGRAWRVRVLNLDPGRDRLDFENETARQEVKTLSVKDVQSVNFYWLPPSGVSVDDGVQ